jgi:hypothetical protein
MKISWEANEDEIQLNRFDDFEKQQHKFISFRMGIYVLDLIPLSRFLHALVVHANI